MALDWIHHKGLRTLYFSLVVALLSSSYQGFDGSIMNGLQSLPQWQNAFDHPNGALLGLLGSIQTVGATVSGLITPYIADAFGRRSTIAVGATITMVGAALQGSSSTVGQFIASRAVIGFGLGMTVIAAPLLIVELAHPKHRGTLISLFPTCYFSGSIIAAWTTFGTFHINTAWSWRIPSLLQAAPAIIQVFLIWIVPESPRWLVSKGQPEKAIQILARYHANGDEQDPIVQLQYKEIIQNIKQDEEAKGWSALFATTANRRRMTIVIFCGIFIEISGNGLVSYYLHSVLNGLGITAGSTQTLINGCLQLWNFGLAIIASSLVEKVGRRTLFLISSSSMCLFFTLWTIFSALYAEDGQRPVYGILVVISIFLCTGAYDIGWTPLYNYPIEVLPYSIRAKGVALQTIVIHLSGFFGQFVNPIGLENIQWRYYIIYVVYTFLQVLVVWYFFAETRGRTLEQLEPIFDNARSWKDIRNVSSKELQSDVVLYEKESLNVSEAEEVQVEGIVKC